MPSVSKKQQRFFGIVRAYQKGTLPTGKTSPEVQRAATSMKKGDVKKFASTKHKGLPEKKKSLPEGYKGEKKDKSLFARYKDLQDPKDPNTLETLLKKKSQQKKMNESVAVKELEDGLVKLDYPSYGEVDDLMKRIASRNGIDTTLLHMQFKAKHLMIPDDWAKKKMFEPIMIPKTPEGLNMKEGSGDDKLKQAAKDKGLDLTNARDRMKAMSISRRRSMKGKVNNPDGPYKEGEKMYEGKKGRFEKIGGAVAGTAGSIAGGLGGAAAMGTAGSAVPLAGTAAGGFAGGVLGSIAGGELAGLKGRMVGRTVDKALGAVTKPMKGSLPKRARTLTTEEGLRDWFGKSKSKDGKGGWVNVVTGGTCASDEPGEGTPKCVSSSKRASMTKAERLSASRRKKKADPNQQSKSGAAKPTYVSTDKKKKVNEEKVSKDHPNHPDRHEDHPDMSYKDAAKIRVEKKTAKKQVESGNRSRFTDKYYPEKKKDLKYPVGNKIVKTGKLTKEQFAAILEDAKMHRQTDINLDRLHDKFSKMDQSVPSNKFMLKRIQKEKKRRQEKAKKENLNPTTQINDSFEIDPKKHKDAQKKQKMRNLAIGNENPNEKKVAEKKAGGPKMMGEGKERSPEYSRGRPGGAIARAMRSKGLDGSGGNQPKKVESKPKYKQDKVKLENDKKKSNISTFTADPIDEAKKPVVKVKLNPDKKIGVKVTDIGAGGKEYVRKNTMDEAKNPAQQAAIAISKKNRLQDMMVARKKKLKETVEMSRKKWKKTHKDFRNDDEKNPRVTRYVDGKGTVSSPVKFTEGSIDPTRSKPKEEPKDPANMAKKKGTVKKGEPDYRNLAADYTPDTSMTEAAAWTRKAGKNKSGGLNEKGRKSYERENPGSDLKAPSKKKGNKRRASFCARMKGMKKKLTSAKTARDPDSRINKSLRAWNCGYEPETGELISEKLGGMVAAVKRKKAVLKQPMKAMDAGARGRRLLQRKEHQKYVSDIIPDHLKDEYTPVIETKEVPKGVKKIAKELDAAVKMHSSQASRLRKAGISEGKKPMVKVKLKDPSKIKVKVTDIGAGGKEYVRKNEIDEEKKKCGEGEYYCNDMKKCRPIPKGYRVGYGGMLKPENESEETKGKNGNGSNGGNGNGNGNGGSHGGNGGSNGGDA